MLRRDLEAAGIAYRDKAGLVADFHSLRHTFVTNLARGGAHPKDAMDLARHSDINLTMARYSHTRVVDRAKALAALPNVAGGPDGPEQQRATGTYDQSADKDDSGRKPTSWATSSGRGGRSPLGDSGTGEGGSGHCNRGITTAGLSYIYTRSRTCRHRTIGINGCRLPYGVSRCSEAMNSLRTVPSLSPAQGAGLSSGPVTSFVRRSNEATTRWLSRSMIQNLCSSASVLASNSPKAKATVWWAAGPSNSAIVWLKRPPSREPKHKMSSQ